MSPATISKLLWAPLALAVALTATTAVAIADTAPAAPTAPTVTTVTGTVGPGFTIDMKLGGKRLTRLKAGTRYRVLVRDRSSIHNFRLTGPGVNRAITGVSFAGTKAIVLTLKKGTYRFLCDPHASSMRGSFRAT